MAEGGVSLSRDHTRTNGHVGYNGKSSDSENTKTTDSPEPLLGSYRLLVSVIGGVLLFSSTACQTSMSSAMVCMIDDDDSVYNNNNNNNNSNNSYNSNSNYDYSYNSNYSKRHRDEWPSGSLRSNKTTDEMKGWRKAWDSNTQGWVVSSFFIGYYAMQMASGLLVTRVGPRRSLVFSMMATGVLHLLSVPTARWCLPLLYVVRTLAGLTTGILLPGTFALVANWSPRLETSLLFAIASNGVDVGSFFTFLLAMFGCETEYQGGWPLVFYGLGMFHLLIGLCLLLCVTDFPSSHPYITLKERRYIFDNRPHEKQAETVPLCSILRSGPVWGFVAAQFATDWVIFMLITEGPIYLQDVLRLSHWATNLLSSFPFLLSLPFGFIIGYTSKTLIENGTASTTTVRKFTETAGKAMCTLPFIILLTLPEGALAGVAILYACVAVGVSFTYCGFMANPGDLSPAHAGFLASLGQLMSTWSSFVIPIGTSYITQEKTRSSWQVVFYITAAVQMFSIVFYLMFGSGALQPWAQRDKAKKTGESTPIIFPGEK